MEEVKINEMEIENNDFLLKGEYMFKTLGGTIIEKGTFEIALDKNKKPKRAKLVPLKR